MLVGGYRALRQNDLKLLLAFGTVSQLGFLMVLVGAGSRELAAAGLAMLVAHALFKSTLFLTVGVIDHATGTRDLRRLSGLGRRLPVLAVVGGLAAASMAGLPPLLGSSARRRRSPRSGTADCPTAPPPSLVLAGLVLGSALTAALHRPLRLGRLRPQARARRHRAGRAGPPARPRCSSPRPAVLAAGRAARGTGQPAARAAGRRLRRRAAAGRRRRPRSSALWHGLQPALALSALAAARRRRAVRRPRAGARLQQRLAVGASADEGYWNTMQGLDRLAVLVTGTTQRGSLPAYLGTILVVVLALPGSVLLFRAPWPGRVAGLGHPGPGAASARVVLIAAVLALRIRQRLSAVLVVGVTGYGLAVLFVLQGAPDLALTQFLVETLTLVVFVLVLRKLPKDITERHRPRERAVRGVIAVAVGLLMAGVGRGRAQRADGDARLGRLPAGGLRVRRRPEHRQRDPGRHPGLGHPRRDLAARRRRDRRGQPGLPAPPHRRRRPARPGPRPSRRPTAGAPRTAPAVAGRERPRWPPSAGRWCSRWSPGSCSTRSSSSRVYLLFSGHNEPGGGFAGGLVAGLALVLRYLAGGRYELGEAAPVDPGLLLGAGLLFAGGTGVVGLALGAEVLQTAILETTLPVLGDVKLVTSLFFDIGVYLIVVGLVLDVLRSLGAELDRQVDEDDPIDAAPDEVIVR